jgi:CDP-diglyceride synthetase
MILTDAIQLFLPLVITNILHMLVVKYDFFSILKVPIHTVLFGKNKTYRGLIFVPCINLISYQLVLFLNGSEITRLTMATGFLLGFVYIICELPNSFLKRRLGVQAGSSSDQYPWMKILDKADSSFGVCAVYVFAFHLSFYDFLILFLGAFSLHMSLSHLLHRMRIKESV